MSALAASDDARPVECGFTGDDVWENVTRPEHWLFLRAYQVDEHAGRDDLMPVRALAAALMRPWSTSRDGLWQAVRCWVERREARLFECERRTTFEAVLPLVGRSVKVVDRRADGSVLELWASPVTGLCGTQAGDPCPLPGEPSAGLPLEGLLVKDIELTAGSDGQD
jgi:hypothetical protein